MEYAFTLRYELAQDDCDQEALVERLGDSGCTDAMIGIGVPERLALTFTREGNDEMSAVRSAVLDVQRAIPSATIADVVVEAIELFSREDTQRLCAALDEEFNPYPRLRRAVTDAAALKFR